MIKNVNIKANIPVRSVRPMVYGNILNIQMDTGDIFKCICGRAIVDEILVDGSLIRLDLNNYDKDNSTLITEEESNNEAPTPVEPTADPQKHNETPLAEEPQEQNDCNLPAKDTSEVAETITLVDNVEVTDTTPTEKPVTETAPQEPKSESTVTTEEKKTNTTKKNNK